MVVTPRFPAPEPGVIEAIYDIDDPAVRRWLVDLADLCRKLEEDCR